MPSSQALDAINAVNALDNSLTQALQKVQVQTNLLTDASIKISSLEQQVADLTATAQVKYPKNNQNALHLLPWVADPNERPWMQWFQPSNTGDTGGGTPKPHGTWNASEASGDSRRYILVKPAYGYNNYFFGLNLVKEHTEEKTYTQTLVFELLDTDAPKCQAIETNWEHCITMPDGKRYRFNQGTQLFFATKQVRYYDIVSGSWKLLSGIPIPPTGLSKLITITNEIQRTDTGMKFVSLTLNGVKYPVNITTQPLASNWGEYLQYGFQMDTLGTPTSYGCVLHNMAASW